jgi:acetylornithine deacetylase/succinyl-diaminopimelate desuccinylase-like protein
VYVDVRIPPTRDPLSVKRELQRFVDAAALDAEVEMYMARRGFVGQGVGPVVESLDAAHRDVFGEPPPSPTWMDISMWNDTNIYAEAGIPAVKYGPDAPMSRHPGRAAIEDIHPERMDIESAMRSAKVYALATARLVGTL